MSAVQSPGTHSAVATAAVFSAREAIANYERMAEAITYLDQHRGQQSGRKSFRQSNPDTSSAAGARVIIGPLHSHRLPEILMLCARRGLASILLFTACSSVTPAQHVQWINGPNNEATTVELTRRFSVGEPVIRAQLRIAAEYCDVAVRLNGQPLLKLDSFGPLTDLDVTTLLRRNQNLISLSLHNHAGPSAVALELTIEHPDNTVRIVSNDLWKAGPNTATPNGAVSPLYWQPGRGSRINLFDDYTQWKRAQPGAESADDFAEISHIDGFEVELVRKAQPQDGSWVSLAFAPEGHLIIAREDKGLLRLQINDNGTAGELSSVNDTLLECRGLLFAYDSLYANANNSKGLYRLREPDAGGRFQRVELLREFPGGVGHGRNDLALGPDGLIYSIHGDAVGLPTVLPDRTSPLRDRTSGQGHLVRTDRDGHQFELVAAGLRNPYGIAFHRDGTAFTYDADAEHDMGAPWYRPTRLDMLASGTDFGWRARTGKWPPYQLDRPHNALPVSTVGKGSPTAVMFGYETSFPLPWRNSLFLLDWAYGRIIACHLFARGAGYVCRTQTFLKGRPLNVTDLATGPDGSLYFITGGRKTESALYRVRWAGTEQTTAIPATSPHRRESNKWSAMQRQIRRKLERLHASAEDSVELIWPFIHSNDPSIRAAATVALEHQQFSEWRDRALSERSPQIAPTVLLAALRAGADPKSVTNILLSDQGPLSAWSDLPGYTRLTLLECIQQSLDAMSVGQKTQVSGWLANRLEVIEPAAVPTGAGRLEWKMARILTMAEPENAHSSIVTLFRSATSQEDQMQYLLLLRNAQHGWNQADREAYFHTLNALERNFLGGDGMPGFLQTIRRDAVATLTDAERTTLGALVETNKTSEKLAITRSHVRNWAPADIEELLQTKPVDLKRGERLFREVLCHRCHRVHQQGGVAGPNLTAAGQRFSKRDLLNSILEPSSVVAEKYRQSVILTTSGKSITGRILSTGDYRSPTLRIQTDVLDPASIREIRKAEIEDHRTAPLSVMPKGLVNSLNKEEIADLVAWLVKGNLKE